MRTSYQYKLRPTKQQTSEIAIPDGLMITTAVLLRSGMMGNYHVPFWRAVEGVTHSLTLIIKNRAVGHSVLKAKSLLSDSRIVLEAYTDSLSTV